MSFVSGMRARNRLAKPRGMSFCGKFYKRWMFPFTLIDSNATKHKYAFTLSASTSVTCCGTVASDEDEMDIAKFNGQSFLEFDILQPS